MSHQPEAEWTKQTAISCEYKKKHLPFGKMTLLLLARLDSPEKREIVYRKSTSRSYKIEIQEQAILKDREREREREERKEEEIVLFLIKIHSSQLFPLQCRFLEREKERESSFYKNRVKTSTL